MSKQSKRNKMKWKLTPTTLGLQIYSKAGFKRPHIVEKWYKQNA